ncbi:MAG: hypothetical protein ACLTSG_05925 [Lachnospiraceae bacterium]
MRYADELGGCEICFPLGAAAGHGFGFSALLLLARLAFLGGAVGLFALRLLFLLVLGLSSSGLGGFFSGSGARSGSGSITWP